MRAIVKKKKLFGSFACMSFDWMTDGISALEEKSYRLTKVKIPEAMHLGLCIAWRSYSLIRKIRGRTSSSGVHSQYLRRMV